MLVLELVVHLLWALVYLQDVPIVLDVTLTVPVLRYLLSLDSTLILCAPQALFEVQVGTETCAESGRNCSNFKICQEAYIGGTLIGTACNFPPFLARSCEELLSCDTDNDMGCSIVTYESFGSLAMCLPRFAVTVEYFQQLLGQP